MENELSWQLPRVGGVSSVGGSKKVKEYRRKLR